MSFSEPLSFTRWETAPTPPASGGDISGVLGDLEVSPNSLISAGLLSGCGPEGSHLCRS